MVAVRRKIASERITVADIAERYEPMRPAIRARILRGEWDEISLTRAILIADAIGLDLVHEIVPEAA